MKTPRTFEEWAGQSPMKLCVIRKGETKEIATARHAFEAGRTAGILEAADRLEARWAAHGGHAIITSTMMVEWLRHFAGEES